MRAIVEPSSTHISGIQKTVSNASKPKKIAMTVHYLEIEANIREKKIHVGQTSASLEERARNQEVRIVPSVQERGHFACKSKSSDTESPWPSAFQHYHCSIFGLLYVNNLL